MQRTQKNIYLCPQLNNMAIIGQNPLTAIRKCVRKLILNAKTKKKDIDIFSTFKNIHLSLVSPTDGKRNDYIISIIKLDENTPKSIYYKMEYSIELYRKLKNI